MGYKMMLMCDFYDAAINKVGENIMFALIHQYPWVHLCCSLLFAVPWQMQ